ncbi:hypothetical protein AB6A40_003674 [Gnathostoma spinigerum]|uniref:Zinc metalloproteinase n=1 Tax=Gnathostoma spinigerum TaxID=75299 RepID=A0ABD6EL19_9BILA
MIACCSNAVVDAFDICDCILPIAAAHTFRRSFVTPIITDLSSMYSQTTFAIFVLVTFVPNVSVIKTRKASPRSLNRIKRLIDQKLEKELENQAAAGQDDDIHFERKNPNAKRHYDELSVNNPDDYFQGDVDLTEAQVEAIETELLNDGSDDERSSPKDKVRGKRKVGREPFYVKWIGEIPINFDFAASVPQSTREKIRQAIALWEKKTCVRFKEGGRNVDRLEFFDGGGCSSFVGKTGGTQGISIATPGCDQVGIISHEIGHALGIFHEQARYDQNKFILINYRNIPLSRWNNFQPISFQQSENYGLPYDTGSVMHYGAFGFARDPYVPTIVTKDRSQQFTIGQRQGPSFLDFAAINLAYHCADHCAPLNCQNGGYVNPNDCLRCLCPDGFGGSLCELPQYSSCGALIKVSTQFINLSSPNYPDFSPSAIDCIWLLEAPPDGKVYLQFTEVFHFQCEDTCEMSYVEIKASADFRVTGYRFCCSKRPETTFTSATNRMILIFHSHDYGVQGFRARVWSDRAPVKKTSPQAPDITPIKSIPEVAPATKSTSGQLLLSTNLASTPTTTSKSSTVPLVSTSSPASLPVSISSLTVSTTSPFSPTTIAITSVSTKSPSKKSNETIDTPAPNGSKPDEHCLCGPWSEWTGPCTQECGGCGRRSRLRQCNMENCRNEEKRACGFNVCPTGTNFILNNGEFHILWKGCCVGLFRVGDECAAIEDVEKLLRVLSSIFVFGNWNI